MKRSATLYLLVLTLISPPLFSLPTHKETLNFHELKTSSEQEYYNTMFEHIYTVEYNGGDIEAPGHLGVFFYKAGAIGGLNEFSMSFSLGNLNYEEEFRLNEQLPRFGSFLHANCESEEDFVSTGFLAKSFFSLANDRITKYERLNIPEKKLYWYSYNPEQFCVEHLTLFNKLYPSERGMWKGLMANEDNIFDVSYASANAHYKKEGKSQTLILTMRFAISQSVKPRLLERSFLPLLPLIPTDKVDPTSTIIYYNHYLEKEQQLTVEQSSIPVQLSALLNNIKVQSPKLALSLHKPPVIITRLIRGKIASFSNTLVNIVENTDNILKTITLTATMDSHQYCFLSGVKAKSLTSNDVKLLTSVRYLGRFKKKESNNPITIIEVVFQLKPSETVEVIFPYFINLRKISEYEQEYERGTYLLGSLALVQDTSKSLTLALPPLQTNEKQIDSTFAFTTLTINNVIFFIIPITIMFFGINTR